MKLIDPLMGYKLASGQVVIHFAFLITMLIIPDSKDGSQDLKDAFNYLLLSHIVSTSFFIVLNFINFKNGGV